MKYSIGLDIGVASVGWCLINNDKKRIEDLGVRVFTAAEQPKTGSSLAEPRRLKRGLRRRLKRTRQRMAGVKALFVKYGLIEAESLEQIYVPHGGWLSPWQLRFESLERKLSGEEFARVLTQLCKRRGYKSMRLDEGTDDDEGKVKGSISDNRALMEQKGYRTAGEMFWKDEKFSKSKRNHEDYNNVVSREMLLDEIKILFEKQRLLGNGYAQKRFEKEFTDLFIWQKPVDEGEKLIEKVGACELIPAEKRAPSRCWTAEKFTILQKINNIMIYDAGEKLPLTAEQREAVYEKCLSRQSPVTYADIRKLLGLEEHARFNMVRYDKDDLSAESKDKLPQLTGYHALKKAINNADEKYWDDIAADEDKLNSIAYALTYWKSKEGVLQQLQLLGLPENIIEALKEIRFDKQKHLSIKAMQLINPYLEQGLDYSAACQAAGMHHSVKARKEKQKKLPPIPAEEIRNPVVIRALSQTRKVINAIIDRYGSPEDITIELARDISKNFKDRKDIERNQGKNREKNDAAKNQMLSEFGINASGNDIRKYRLWLEQESRCIYSGKYIDPRRMLVEKGYADIEHIIPYSKSFNSSYMNEALALAEENHKKGNRIPYEYFGHDEARWNEFSEKVNSLNIPYSKKRNLLIKSFDSRAEEAMKERHLNDTRYISRFITNFIKENLITTGEGKDNVTTINGQATAYLRARWGLNKDRKESDRHHAMDAAVAAVATRSMLQRIARFLSWKSFYYDEDNEKYIDKETGEMYNPKKIPEPWDRFARELEARISDSPREYIEQNDLPGYRNEDLGFVRPIFVSRSPRKKISGSAHAETIRKLKGNDEIGRILTTKRVRLEELNLTKLEKMSGKDTDPQLYRLLKNRLDQYNDNPKKAFAEPVYKLLKDGSPGPDVKKIQVDDDPASGGVLVNGGLADNGSMIRIDIFLKDKKYYIVPVYVAQTVYRELPDKAITAHKPESEWIQMDDTFEFEFSLYPGDLLKIEDKKKTLFGYYTGCNRATGSIDLDAHDRSTKFVSIGIRNASKITKYCVDPLGYITPVSKEKRHGF